MGIDCEPACCQEREPNKIIPTEKWNQPLTKEQVAMMKHNKSEMLKSTPSP